MKYSLPAPPTSRLCLHGPGCRTPGPIFAVANVSCRRRDRLVREGGTWRVAAFHNTIKRTADVGPRHIGRPYREHLHTGVVRHVDRGSDVSGLRHR
jgi:hypothetical protein